MSSYPSAIRPASLPSRKLAAGQGRRFNGTAILRPHVDDWHHWMAWLPLGNSGLRAAFRWASHETGMPAVVIAAAAVVASWRFARHAYRLALEVAIAVGLLLVATRMGWIRW